jgi:ubiquinone/menaquinone biosynthesis C-methylase UbiE
MSEFSPEAWVGIHNAAAQGYKDGAWSREGLLRVAKKRAKLFSRAKGNVLDVACGYGINFQYLTDASRISGVDFSPVMLEMAREQVKALKVPVELSQGDAEALDFPDDSFDTVVSAMSTCSFLHPVAALREMRRVCKPDGRIMLLEHGRSSWELLGRYQDRNLAEMLRTAGCRWNQQPQENVRQAGLEILSDKRSFFGVFHAIEASPGKV